VDLPDVLPDVMIDAGRIQQVLANLIDNAAKYSPAGSPILVSATTQAAGVTVGVHDHGPGISSEHAQKIFDRFYRIDDARIRNTGGIGLGLAISRALVEAHGGRLWLDSVPGQGSTFYFSVPIAQPQADTSIEPGVEASESIGAK
jgi:signal transduction histidine kinase